MSEKSALDALVAEAEVVVVGFFDDTTGTNAKIFEQVCDDLTRPNAKILERFMTTSWGPTVKIYERFFDGIIGYKNGITHFWAEIK